MIPKIYLRMVFIESSSYGTEMKTGNGLTGKDFGLEAVRLSIGLGCNRHKSDIPWGVGMVFR